MRADKAGLPSDRFQLRQGDAAKDLDAEPAGSRDAVLAVDCAYQCVPLPTVLLALQRADAPPRSFNTRRAFLSSAARLLVPGGHLALTDLVLPSTPLSRLDTLLLHLLLLLAGCPTANLVSERAYRAQLVTAGFDAASIELRDISSDVWPGFCRFVREREARLGGRGRGVLGSKWTGLVRYASVVEWYAGLKSGRPKMRYCLVAARKA